MRRLIRVNTVCLKDTSISVKMIQNNSDAPKMMNGLFQLIRIEEFTQHKWVKKENQDILLKRDL